MKVLLVDDDKAVRESVRKVLNGAGYDVLVAADGPEALTQFDSHPIDLLLLDLGLPIKTGWDIFEHISNADPLLPIIIITGQANKYDIAAAAGVGALMEKPLDAGQLLRTISELLSEPKEVRLHRLGGHRGEVRHIPPGSALLLKQLREQHEKPFHFKAPRSARFP
jgi:DNA-binding response OmpR family regulator